MKFGNDEVGRNVTRTAANLRQRQVLDLMAAIASGEEVSAEDVRYVHSVLDDAATAFSRAVASL